MSRILLLLLLSAFPAVAQDSATAGARSAGDESQTAPTGGNESRSQGSDPVGAGSTGDQSRSQTAPTGGDPFDYESSEQISEDLSVSFPVDI